MDDDLNNVLVLTVFAGCLISAIVGYLIAWRSNRTKYRKAGSLVTAAVVGFAGLVMSAWLMGAVTPFPPPDGSSIWEPQIGFRAKFSSISAFERLSGIIAADAGNLLPYVDT